MPERLALVTGATGAIGPSVVRACLAAGFSVRAFSLDVPSGDELPPGVEVRRGDVCDPRAVQEAMSGVDVVLHLAALLHQFRKGPDLDRQFECVNVGGTENIVRAAAAEGVRRVVLLSTICVYGPSSGRLLDETTPPCPDTAYGRTKLSAEGIVLSARRGGEPMGTVLRSAAVYGARVKGNYKRLGESIARGRFVQVGPCLNRRTLVHDSDLARAVVLAAQHPAAAGAAFNVTDGCVHTLADIIAAIHRAVGRRPPRLHVPLGPVRVAARGLDGVRSLFGLSAPAAAGLVEKYTEDLAVDGGLITRTLGFEPSIDLESGWREALAPLRDRARDRESREAAPHGE